MTSKFKLTFSTDLNKNLLITINDANPKINIDVIKQVMDKIISTKAIKSQLYGTPVKKIGAEIENTKVDYIDFE